ncbi:MAG: hypothetical protein V2I48_04060 [Xanthomonadales bacterium]|jgi:hypothetical protein|nr:hypothetical protein [Xanthomonadales bacterium]
MRPVLILALLLPTALVAQELEEPSAPSPALRCDTAEHHQFDFWLGDWNVSADGLPAGTNSVQSIQGGCALQEHWKGSGIGGISGTSFNIYDRDSGNWHQTWVDASGTLLQLDGGLVDGVMVLEGKRPAPGGAGATRHRIAWTPNPDGTVRQLWEASQDDGGSWNVIFDGLYTRTETP